MQVKLLRLIETGMFRRVGGIEQLQADFRLICATHQPLPSMVQEGRFRQDLYFRISAFPIRLPALRERLEDLPAIALALLRRTRGSLSTRAEPITAAALALLAQHDWPGNVRELRNVLDRASLYSAGAPIEEAHLLQGGFVVQAASSFLGQPVPSLVAQTASSGFRERPPEMSFDGSSLRAHRAAAVGTSSLEALVRQWQGSRADLARHLGMSERTLYRRLREAGLARALRTQHISMPPSTSSD
jgi:DNA-binding NtrC family response regulator